MNAPESKAGRDMDDFLKCFFLTPVSLDKMPDAQIPIDRFTGTPLLRRFLDLYRNSIYPESAAPWRKASIATRWRRRTPHRIDTRFAAKLARQSGSFSPLDGAKKTRNQDGNRIGVVMNKKLKRLVGRNVRLKLAAFQKLVANARPSRAIENFFVVAAVTGGMSQLICYGANLRVVVSLADVILI